MNMQMVRYNVPRPKDPKNKKKSRRGKKISAHTLRFRETCGPIRVKNLISVGGE